MTEHIKMCVVYEIFWCNGNIASDHPEYLIVQPDRFTQQSWMYAEPGKLLGRMLACLKAAPSSNVIVERQFMPLSEYKALLPDEDPVPLTARQVKKRVKRAARKAERIDLGTVPVRG